MSEPLFSSEMGKILLLCGNLFFLVWRKPVCSVDHEKDCFFKINLIFGFFFLSSFHRVISMTELIKVFNEFLQLF